MRCSCLFPAALALLPAACAPMHPGAPGAAYRCADGRVIRVTYEDGGHALLMVDDEPYRLDVARSASGARYVGGGWQWWTRGMRSARLAPLQPGETIASAPGVACQAR